jgi:pentatricopeptide repeat protein
MRAGRADEAEEVLQELCREGIQAGHEVNGPCDRGLTPKAARLPAQVVKTS